jgi:hypothetical protein
MNLPNAKTWEPLRQFRGPGTAEAQFSGLCPEPGGPMAWGYAVELRGILKCGGGSRQAHTGNDDCAAYLCGLGAAGKALAAMRPEGIAPNWLTGVVLACDCPPLVRALWDWTASEIPERHGKLAAAAVGAVLAAVGGAVLSACEFPHDWLGPARDQAEKALSGLAKGAAA